jgi:hypothetical protein
VLLTILILARRPLVRCFNSNEEVIEYAAYFLGVISPFYLVTSFNQIYAGALRGTGDSRTPMIIMLFSFVVFRQAYLYINKLLGNSFLMVALAYPMGWVVCSILEFIYYRKSKLYREFLTNRTNSPTRPDPFQGRCCSDARRQGLCPVNPARGTESLWTPTEPFGLSDAPRAKSTARGALLGYDRRQGLCPCQPHQGTESLWTPTDPSAFSVAPRAKSTAAGLY